MPITTAQHELLQSFFGCEGCYFEALSELSTVDLGTKVLYLERAIEQDCQTFLKSLDKLYPIDPTESQKKECIDLIIPLKLINDLFYNNEIKLDDYGVKKAHLYYFGKLGQVDSKSLSAEVEALTNFNIKTLVDDREKEVAQQKNSRINAENNISRNTHWRKERDLPQNQLDILGMLNNFLTEQQYQSLTDEVQSIIAENTNALLDLLQNHGFTFANLQRLTTEEISELFRFLPSFSRLVKSAYFSREGILALDKNIRSELFQNSHHVLQLLDTTKVLPSRLLSLEPPLRKELYNNLSRIKLLTREANIPLFDLLALKQEVRTELFKQAHKVTASVKKQKGDLNQLLFFHPSKDALRFLAASNTSSVPKDQLLPCYRFNH